MKFSEKNLCFLDLETTGFEPEKDSIIEISFLVKNPQGKTIRSFDKVIIPDKNPLTDFITELTGITQTEIDTNGIILNDPQKKEIQTLIGDAIIVGHNIDFDIRFLESNGIECQKNGRIDTHELSRILLVGEPSYALEVLSKKYGFSHTNAHRAMSDVEVSSDLYSLLKEKIEALPSSFLEKFLGILKTKTNWEARHLFLESRATGTYFPMRVKEKIPIPPNDISQKIKPPKILNTILEKVQSTPQFIRAGVANKTAALQKELAQKSEEKILIITEKFDYFIGYELFPTPEVLLDPERLKTFQEKRPVLTDQEITLYLQILFRHELGYRGKNDMDTYFQQNSAWTEFQIQSEKEPLFEKISQEKISHKVLVISPAAYVQFCKSDLFLDRILIVDEGEILAEKILFGTAQKISLAPFLNSENEKISIAIQFWIRNFCQEILKIELGHELSPFPVKVLLPENISYKNLAESLHQFDSQRLENLRNFLSSPEEKLVRWAEYNPKDGNLQIGIWHPTWWRKTKDFFCRNKRIIFHRHTLDGSNSFFRIFTGTDTGDFFFFPEIFSEKKWIVPDGLVSVKSPDFNTFCAHEIVRLIKKYVSKDKKLGVLFSSLESLRKIFLETNTILKNTSYSLLGEKISGGKGKIFELIPKKEFLTLFLQKMRGRSLENRGFETIILQKFLFSAPHPLLEKIESVLKSSNQSLWDIWTLPSTIANVSRKVADFPEIKTIICFDGRANALWGKTLLKSAFPEIKKNF